MAKKKFGGPLGAKQEWSSYHSRHYFYAVYFLFVIITTLLLLVTMTWDKVDTEISCRISRMSWFIICQAASGGDDGDKEDERLTDPSADPFELGLKHPVSQLHEYGAKNHLEVVVNLSDVKTDLGYDFVLNVIETNFVSFWISISCNKAIIFTGTPNLRPSASSSA